jgi:hypothetical protein
MHLPSQPMFFVGQGVHVLSAQIEPTAQAVRQSPQWS